MPFIDAFLHRYPVDKPVDNVDNSCGKTVWRKEDEMIYVNG